MITTPPEVVADDDTGDDADADAEADADADADADAEADAEVLTACEMSPELTAEGVPELSEGD